MNAKKKNRLKKQKKIQQHSTAPIFSFNKTFLSVKKKGATHCLMITKCSVETVNLHPISIQCK